MSTKSGQCNPGSSTTATACRGLGSAVTSHCMPIPPVGLTNVLQAIQVDVCQRNARFPGRTVLRRLPLLAMRRPVPSTLCGLLRRAPVAILLGPRVAGCTVCHVRELQHHDKSVT